jgi:hypothetical protein
MVCMFWTRSEGHNGQQMLLHCLQVMLNILKVFWQGIQVLIQGRFEIHVLRSKDQIRLSLGE